ncbi:MAG: DinB family protein [Lapillicoccus sp.]
MPGTPPPVASEREAISTYLRQQHDGLRNAAYGLTDEQAHQVPSRSVISIANLVKHVTHTERTWMERARAGAVRPAWSHGETGRSPESPKDARPTEEQAADYGADWNADGERIEDLLAAFDEVARNSEAAALDESLDLDQPVPVPRDAPWFPKDVEAWSVRWVYFHLLEELARHAGHADIVREHLDGATTYELMAGAEGWPETPWLKPWRPAAV